MAEIVGESDGLMQAVALEPTDVEVRIGLQSDTPFIVKAWLAQRHIYPNSYAMDWVERKTREILARVERSTVLVAHLEGDPDTILSFLIFQLWRGECVVLYAYTDEGARRQGIVRRLLGMANPAQRPVVFLHAPMNENVMRHIVKRAVFAPWMWEQT